MVSCSQLYLCIDTQIFILLLYSVTLYLNYNCSQSIAIATLHLNLTAMRTKRFALSNKKLPSRFVCYWCYFERTFSILFLSRSEYDFFYSCITIHFQWPVRKCHLQWPSTSWCDESLVTLLCLYVKLVSFTFYPLIKANAIILLTIGNLNVRCIHLDWSKVNRVSTIEIVSTW